MELKVNLSKWQCNKNRGPPRPQSREKQSEIKKQIDNYIKLGVVRPINASEYSNVHMVPKPTPGEWRFCLDFVRLNDCTEGSDGWPIPNISEMITRIGSRKSTIFGVMDMTSGYHQAPISASSQIFTAFTCFMGIFCWLRVPMGLKNAASYFQRVMATVVLAGILYIACELYIDDIFVSGKDAEDFISNLEEVFKRLRKHKVTLNPKKCRFGLPSVEYVGHVISAEGVSFSPEKREKVLQFPLPSTQKELQAFLGLINYFRDHIRSMTEYEKPLRALINPNIRDKRLVWTEAAKTCFFEARDIVGNCPGLYFANEHALIVVMTDASDYGVGAYIYQIIDGKEYPVMFFSRSLHGAELNWSTMEKEAFAIFLTLTKFNHLLRDNKFLLRTDHKNLTYINAGSSQKVRRWGIALQEFDFDIEHIAGSLNTVADSFSRLCVNNTPLAAPTQEGVLANIEIFPQRLSQESYETISSAHNTTVGHFGVEKTLQHLRKANIKWTGMRANVRQFIQQCPVCQKLREHHLAIKAHPFTTASYLPMEILNIDTIGPLTEDEEGNKYILVIIDCFTRWVELYPTKDTSAKAAALALLQHVGRFGAPSTLRSDKGSQFVNQTIEELSSLIITNQQISMAYSKEENAIVERANKEVDRHLRAIVFDKRVLGKWSKNYLPLVMRILNSEEKANTGLTPAELLFGNNVDLGRRILHEPFNKPRQASETLSEYMDELLEAQATLIKVAQEKQHKHDTHHLSTFDSNYTEFPINSYVLLILPEGNRTKLLTTRKGPYQVINFVGSKYVIQDLMTGRNFDTHISNLVPFNFDDTRTDPVEVAMHDQQEFLVERIISHRGDPTRHKSMEFLVKWTGYPDDSNSWEPFKNLRDNEQAIEYMNNNRLRSLIPRRHKV